MAVVVYDQYGRRPDAMHYGDNSNPPGAYIVDESTEGVTYVCYFNTPLRAVWRITKTGSVTTIERAWGAWSDRANLVYAPVNDFISVTE